MKKILPYAAIFTLLLTFALYDSASGGSQIGGAITTSLTLANGLFTVNLDFGAGAFNGSARWLDISITNGVVGQTLSPRVQVLPAPYAQFAAVAATVTNHSIMNSQLATNAVATTNIQNGAIMNAQLAAYAVSAFNIQNGAVTNANLTANAVNATNIASGQVVKSLNGLSDVASLLVGANLALNTNGNTLQISTGSNLVSAVDGNLKIVRGIISNNNGTPTNLFGTGFTLSFTPAGIGGTEFFIPGIPIELYPGDSSFVVGSETGYFPQGSIFMVQNGSTFYVVQNVEFVGTNQYGVNQFQVTFSPNYEDYFPSGPDVFVEGMTLNPLYAITYTTPFSSPPTVLVSADGGGSQSEFFQSDTLSVTRSNVVTALSAFYVLSQNISLGLGNGGPIDQGPGFDFIAIGPK
jgi:hypothetical protein